MVPFFSSIFRGFGSDFGGVLEARKREKSDIKAGLDFSRFFVDFEPENPLRRWRPAAGEGAL